MCERLRSNHESAAHRDAVSMEESSSAGIKSFTDVAMIAGGGRDVNERFAAFLCAFAPHPPTLCSHKVRRGMGGVLMPETGDGMPGLANQPAPARARAPEGCAGCAGVPPACAPEARAPRKGSVPGRDARAFPCAFAPSSPLPLDPTRGMPHAGRAQ